MRRHNLGHIMAANYAENPEIRQRHLDALWAEDEDDRQIVIRIKK